MIIFQLIIFSRVRFVNFSKLTLQHESTACIGCDTFDWTVANRLQRYVAILAGMISHFYINKQKLHHLAPQRLIIINFWHHWNCSGHWLLMSMTVSWINVQIILHSHWLIISSWIKWIPKFSIWPVDVFQVNEFLNFFRAYRFFKISKFFSLVDGQVI